MKNWLIGYNLHWRDISSVTSDVLQSQEFPTKAEILSRLYKANAEFNVTIAIISVTEVPEGWDE